MSVAHYIVSDLQYFDVDLVEVYVEYLACGINTLETVDADVRFLLTGCRRQDADVHFLTHLSLCSLCPLLVM
jgi:hypothetical protein